MPFIEINQAQAIALDKDNINVRVLSIHKDKYANRYNKVMLSDLSFEKKIKKLKRLSDILVFYVEDVRI